MSNEYDLQQQQSNGLARQLGFPSEILPTRGTAMEELDRAWAAQFRQSHAKKIAKTGLEGLVEFDREVEAAVMARPRVQQGALLLYSVLTYGSVDILNNFIHGRR